MIRRPPRSTRVRSSAASDVYKRQGEDAQGTGGDADVGLVALADVVAVDLEREGPRSALTVDCQRGDKGFTDSREMCHPAVVARPGRLGLAVLERAAQR